SRTADDEKQQPAQQQPAGSLDVPARQACDDFDNGYRDASTKAERLGLADRVMTSTRRSDNKAIKDSATEMGKRASDGGAAGRPRGGSRRRSLDSPLPRRRLARRLTRPARRGQAGKTGPGAADAAPGPTITRRCRPAWGWPRRCRWP